MPAGKCRATKSGWRKSRDELLNIAAMKSLLTFAIAFLLLSAPAAPQASSAGLDRVLAEMDKASSSFRSAEANFIWDQYQKVIDETETQKGKIYFRHQDNDTQMAADIAEPDKKYVLYTGG